MRGVVVFFVLVYLVRESDHVDLYIEFENNDRFEYFVNMCNH